MPLGIAARIVSALGLAAAIHLYSRNWWYTGPAYLVLHVVIVGGAAGLSAVLRRAGDGLCRALDATALSLPVVSFLGGAVGTWTGARDPALAGACGASAELVAVALRRAAPVWAPLAALVLAALWRRSRRRALAALGPTRALATSIACVSSPPALVVVGVLVAGEFMSGGAAVAVLHVLVVATVATALSWTLGVRSPATDALQVLAPLLAACGVALGTAVELRPVACEGPLGHDWALLSLGRFGVVVAAAAASLLLARARRVF